MIKPIKKPNAGVAKMGSKGAVPTKAKEMVKQVTGGKRVMRGMKAPMTKNGVKPNIPIMDSSGPDDRTGSMTGAPSPAERAKLKFKD
jgi:hypothetical protein